MLAYRLALTSVALAQLALALQWRQWGARGLWPWLVVMALGLGLALRWIHIYLGPCTGPCSCSGWLGCVGLCRLGRLAGSPGDGG